MVQTCPARISICALLPRGRARWRKNTTIRSPRSKYSLRLDNHFFERLEEVREGPSRFLRSLMYPGGGAPIRCSQLEVRMHVTKDAIPVSAADRLVDKVKLLDICRRHRFSISLASTSQCAIGFALSGSQTRDTELPSPKEGRAPWITLVSKRFSV